MFFPERARLKKQKAQEKAERKAKGIRSEVTKEPKKKKKKGWKARDTGHKAKKVEAGNKEMDMAKALDKSFGAGMMGEMQTKDADFGKEVKVDL